MHPLPTLSTDSSEMFRGIIARLLMRYVQGQLRLIGIFCTRHCQQQLIAAEADMVVAIDQIAALLLPAIANALAAEVYGGTNHGAKPRA